MPVPRLRDARPAGWVNCFNICASKMPRAKNRTAKGCLGEGGGRNQRILRLLLFVEKVCGRGDRNIVSGRLTEPLVIG